MSDRFELEFCIWSLTSCVALDNSFPGSQFSDFSNEDNDIVYCMGLVWESNEIMQDTWAFCGEGALKEWEIDTKKGGVTN